MFWAAIHHSGSPRRRAPPEDLASQAGPAVQMPKPLEITKFTDLPNGIDAPVEPWLWKKTLPKTLCSWWYRRQQWSDRFVYLFRHLKIELDPIVWSADHEQAQFERAE